MCVRCPNLGNEIRGCEIPLLSVEKPAQMTFRNPKIDSKEKALEEVRRPTLHRSHAAYKRNVTATAMPNSALRLARCLQQDGFPSETTEKIANWDPYNQNASADFFDPRMDVRYYRGV